VHEVQQLRDAQTRISERNRLDSLQLLRIQNNLSELAFSMRDMADRTDAPTRSQAISAKGITLPSEI
jgi:hypothetical protein